MVVIIPNIITKKKQKYLPCMLCGRRRIKTTQKHTSMGMTTIEHISEGMCRQCAWERINHKCKICGEVIEKGYPRLIAHITSHYTSNEHLYNENRDIDIISINFERAKTSNKWLVVDEDEKGQHPLRCKTALGRSYDHPRGITTPNLISDNMGYSFSHILILSDYRNVT